MANKMTIEELAGTPSVQVAALVEQKKVDAATAGAFLLQRFTNRLHKQAEQAEKA